MAVDYSTAITDRSDADLLRFRELDAKKFKDMSASERAEWLAGLKATYNASDLNRVGGFIADLQEQLHGIGITVNVQPKTDWTMNNNLSKQELAEQLEQYIKDLHTLKGALEIDTPDIPDTMEKLTLTGANSIELLCVNLNRYIANISNSGAYCDEIFSGEV